MTYWKKYWDKWKEALDSKKIIEAVDSIKHYDFDSEHEGLIRESEARLRQLKKGLPDIEFPDVELPTLEIESARRFEKAIEIQESEKENNKITLREYYGFKETNYDID